jgi:hypothetical protein
MYPGTVPMRNRARPVIHRIQSLRPVVDCSWDARASAAAPGAPLRVYVYVRARIATSTQLHTNFGRNFPYSRNHLHAVRVWPECGRLTAGPFFLGVRPDRTPSKNGPESQGPREGQMRTACSASTVPGVGSDRRSSARDRSSDHHACVTPEELS